MPADWLWGMIGGLMIGSAGALYLLVNGRVMGASGILGGLVDGSGRSTAGERLAFVAALIAVPGLAALVWPTAGTNAPSDPALLVAAGLLVGLGTRIAGGCTSGHGVCGISRPSQRGIAASLAYILAGAATMAVARHWLGVL
jgi:uncharacterized membrane protein YedE/YeeE